MHEEEIMHDEDDEHEVVEEEEIIEEEEFVVNTESARESFLSMGTVESEYEEQEVEEPFAATRESSLLDEFRAIKAAREAKAAESSESSQNGFEIGGDAGEEIVVNLDEELSLPLSFSGEASEHEEVIDETEHEEVIDESDIEEVADETDHEDIEEIVDETEFEEEDMDGMIVEEIEEETLHEDYSEFDEVEEVVHEEEIIGKEYLSLQCNMYNGLASNKEFAE